MEGVLKDTAETRAQMKTNGIPHDIYIGYLFLLYEETFEFMVKYHGTNEREFLISLFGMWKNFKKSLTPLEIEFELCAKGQ